MTTGEGSTQNSIEGDLAAAVQMRDVHGDVYVGGAGNTPRKRVDVDVEAGDVEGQLAGLRAGNGLGDVTDVEANVKVKRVSTGGEVVGIDLTTRDS
ncbi:hypothetical protein [Lentzea sp. NPDC003310]|uniref:hypothetical protein n=1 Tax=Lentzea sp. NPDC003310 TaxID=3154447 RepID=UPI0033B7DFF3